MSALAAIAVSSCQKEQPIGGGVFGKEAQVSFTVNVPSQVQTKGIAEADNIDIVYYQIWNTPTDPSKEAVKLYPTTGECASAAVTRNLQTGQMEATISLSLVKDQTYTFIFWAQNGDFTGYTRTDLRNVAIDYSKFGGNNDACDAFYAYEQIEVKGAIERTIVLTRPFAQLNFGASAMKCDLGDVKLGATTVTVSKLSTVFNTATGLGDGTKVAENVKFDATGLASTTENLVTETGNYHWVKMDYMLMQEDQDNVTIDASFNVGIPGIDKPVTHKITEVPLKKNHRTNVVGDLFTTGAKLTIIVDERFDTPDLAPADVLKNVLAEGGEFTLLEDMTISENFSLSNNTVVNLNGHKFTYDGSDDIFARVQSGATLTFNGPGSVESTGYVASANAGGKVVVNGGSYFTSSTTLFQANGGEVEIYGGSFANENAAYGVRYLLNHVDTQKNKGLITVCGGSFKGYNPAESKSENPAMNFCADGYTVTYDATTDTYTVVKFADLVAKGGEVKIAGDLVLGESVVIENDAVIDLNGKTVTAPETVYVPGEASALFTVKSGTVTLRNGKVDGTGSEDYAVEVRGGKLVIESGEYTGSVTAVYAVEGEVEILGGEFKASETSYGATYLLNVMDDAPASISVKGGTFHGFNPADNKAEGAGTDFVAEGYKSVETPAGSNVWVVSEK